MGRDFCAQAFEQGWCLFTWVVTFHVGGDFSRKVIFYNFAQALEDVHKGRFGFVTDNFLSVSSMDNTWAATWEVISPSSLLLSNLGLSETKVYEP